MSIRRKLSLAVVTIGITVSTVSASAAPVTEPIRASSVVEQVSLQAQQPITVASDIVVTFPRSEVKTIAAPVALSEPAIPVTNTWELSENPATLSPAGPTAAQVPVATGIKTPIPVAAPVPAVSQEVYVGLTGGQGVVDLGRGPVLGTMLGAGWPPYIVEHDHAGGWARFGSLRQGMTVKVSGLVGGTYTVGQIINVPKGGSSSELFAFKTMPKVLLQTCVPGTSRMIVVGLY